MKIIKFYLPSSIGMSQVMVRAEEVAKEQALGIYDVFIEKTVSYHVPSVDDLGKTSYELRTDVHYVIKGISHS